jgi:hypothetical protein
MPPVTQLEIDQQVFDLYDEYCHGRIDRREFLKRAGALGAASLAMAQALLPQYAKAQTISFTDSRIKATYVTYPSPGGNSGTMRGYLVQPSGAGPFPAVLVIHENRGLNPYIEDVARRAAVEGFVALAPDGLHPAGGYPGNDDDGRALQAKLDQGKLRTDMLNSARFLKSHALSSGKLGVTGFCWGGGTTNYLAAAMGADLPGRSPLLRRRGGDGVGAENQGAAPHPLRRERRAHQLDVAGLRAGVAGGGRVIRGARVSRHPARLSQQLDAALQRAGGEARVGADGGLFQEEPRLSARQGAPGTGRGPRRAGRATPGDIPASSSSAPTRSSRRSR